MVVAGTTVNISGTGLFGVSGGTSIEPINAGAFVNVNSGGVLRPQAIIALNSGNLVLNGGTLRLHDADARVNGHITISSNSNILMNGYSVGRVNPVAHGSGKITITGTMSDTRTYFGFAAGSDWTGDLEISDNCGGFGGGGGASGYLLARTIPSNLHLGSGAVLSSYNFNTTGWNGLPKDVTGTGTLTNYGTADWAVSGTGNMKPGATPGAAGTLTVAAGNQAGAGGNNSSSLTFNSNATYTADITGTGTGAFDQIVVKGYNAGVGNITINNGAKLEVNLFKPTVNTSLDVVIIDASGTATGSPFTGLGSSITWNIASGPGTWSSLQTSWSGPDLHVTGTFVVPEPTSAAGLLASGALMALRRKKRS